MEVLIQLLRFRFIQANRLIKTAGYFLVLIVAFLALSMISSGLVFLIESPAWVYFTVIFILLILVHYQRKDLMFLERLFDNNKQILLLYFLEYLIFQIPIFIFFVASGLWFKVLCVFGAALGASLFGKYFVKEVNLKKSKVSIGLLPIHLFEFKFFFERGFGLLIIILALILLGLLHFASYFVFVFLISICLPEAFKYIEDRSMLKWSPNFVAKKMLQYLGFIQVLLLPALSIACINQIDHWIWYLWGYGIVMLNLCMFITFKYRHYSPDRISVGSSNALVLYILFNFLPGFFIVPLIYTLINYVKAERNMKFYYA